MLPAHTALQVLELPSCSSARTRIARTWVCNERGRALPLDKERISFISFEGIRGPSDVRRLWPIKCISRSTNLRRSMASPTCCKSIHAPGRWNLRRHKPARSMSCSSRWSSNFFGMPHKKASQSCPWVARRPTSDPGPPSIPSFKPLSATSFAELFSLIPNSPGELLLACVGGLAGHSVDPGSAWEPTAPSSSSAQGRTENPLEEDEPVGPGLKGVRSFRGLAGSSLLFGFRGLGQRWRRSSENLAEVLRASRLSSLVELPVPCRSRTSKGTISKALGSGPAARR